MRLDFSGKLGPIVRLPSGAVKVPAYLTRTGIFTYTKADGTQIKELRTPEEVFAPAALDSFKGVPLTVGHPGRVTTDNWRHVAVGHIGEDVQRKSDSHGDFVYASVYIQDSQIANEVFDKKLVELSCGYDCTVEDAKGDLLGEHYDGIQRGIIGNHVALGPKDWGRAGSSVKLYVDSAVPNDIAVSYTYSDMEPKTDQNEVKVVPFAEFEKVSAERDALKAKCDGLSAELSKADSKLSAALELRTKARKLVGDSFDFSGKSDRDVLVASIVAADPDFKADGRSNEYLSARFDIAADQAVKADAARGQLNQDATVAATSSVAKDVAEEAKARMAERNANAWKTK